MPENQETTTVGLSADQVEQIMGMIKRRMDVNGNQPSDRFGIAENSGLCYALLTIKDFLSDANGGA